MIQPTTINDVIQEGVATAQASIAAREKKLKVLYEKGLNEGIGLLADQLEGLREAVLVRVCDRCDDTGVIDRHSGVSLAQTRRAKVVDGPSPAWFVPDRCPSCLGMASPSYVLDADTWKGLKTLLAPVCEASLSGEWACDWAGQPAALAAAVIRFLIPTAMMATLIGELEIEPHPESVTRALWVKVRVPGRDINLVEHLRPRKHQAIALLAGPAFVKPGGPIAGGPGGAG